MINGPQIAWINITERCNNRCLYCYAKDSLHDRNKIISLKEIKKLINKLVLIKTNRCILIGGEPTLHPDIIEIFKYGLSKGIIMSIVSNGTRFADEKFCQLFIDSGLNKGSVTISMHASSNSDSFEITKSGVYFSLFTKGVKNLVKSNLQPGINITISQANKNKIKIMMNWLKLNKINEVHFNLGGPAVSLNSIDTTYILSFEELSKIVEDIYIYGKEIKIKTQFLFLAPLCILPKKLFTALKIENLLDTGCSIRTGSGIIFNINRDVVTCNHLLDFPIINKNIFNYVNNKSRLIKIWNLPKLENIRKSIMVYRLKECKNCKEFDLCQGGGCPLFWLNKKININFYKW